MAKIKLSFPDGGKKEYDSGITGMEIAKQIGEGLARAALAVKLNDKLIDLDRPIEESGSFSILTFKEGMEIFRHSSAHLLASAVLELYPKAKPTIGPAVEEGFYYDFDMPPLKPEDLEKIEKKMKERAEKDEKSERIELTKEKAKEMFKDNPYKLELIEEAEEPLSAYKHGDFVDLCRGPHIPRMGMIKAIKLTKLAGAYWRGDAKNKQLQRIYGISFPDKKQLKEYLKMIEEAEKRDHKRLGKGLFMISEMIGKGLPVWLPKGEVLKKQIEDFAIETERKAGYVRVTTPHVAKEELFLKSGHLPHFEHGMYPKMEMDDGTYYLKAMNCPMHHLIYKHLPRSYRELPLRIAEYGTCYRNELSGTLSGLLRVRMLTMNDAHIYCTREQIGSEIAAVIKMIQDYYKVFGFEDYYFRLSLWDPNNKEKYIDEPENWEDTQQMLKKSLQDMGCKFEEAVGEAAFYGPKVDVQFKMVTGREETMSTVQLDFSAKERFELSYADKDGTENKDVFVIHRAPLSVHERFAAFLIEHFAGKFPLWLNPVQVRILPITDRHNDYAYEVSKRLEEAGLRVEVDDKALTTNKKIREAELSKVNYILVVGDKEVGANTVNVRTRDNNVIGEKNVDEFIQQLVEEVRTKKL